MRSDYKYQHSRRRFVGLLSAALAPVGRSLAGEAPVLPFPVVDYHVHLNPGLTLADAVALANSRGVKFGIAEHAGKKENGYANIITSDAELWRWYAKLDGQPVYKGLQAEWTDWPTCFSKEAVAKLDYVLSDAMTMPGPNGERVKMWTAGFKPGDAQDFMERYVKWNVEVINREPLDIFAHPTWLPAPLDKDAARLWTEERMMTVISALRRSGTAVEIDSDFKVPSLIFLRMARGSGLKFAFGSNSGTGPARGLDYCIEMAKTLQLTAKDMFVPGPRDRKPIMRRKIG